MALLSSSMKLWISNFWSKSLCWLCVCYPVIRKCHVYKRSPNFFVYPGMPSLSLVTSWSLCASGFCLKNWTTHQTPQNSHLVPRKYSGYVLHTESVRLHVVYYYFHVHTSRDHKASTLYADTEVIESKQPGKLNLLFQISNHFFWNLPPQLSLLLLPWAATCPLLLSIAHCRFAERINSLLATSN